MRPLVLACILLSAVPALAARRAPARPSNGRHAVAPARPRAAGPARRADSEETPPPVIPGAFIRTPGSLFRNEAAPAARLHEVEAGPIVVDERKALPLTNHPGLFVGPRDTPPPANSGAGGGGPAPSGRTAITEK